MIIEIVNNLLYVLQFIIVAALFFQTNHRMNIRKIIIIVISLLAVTVALYYVKNTGIQMIVMMLYIFGVIYSLYTEKKILLAFYIFAMIAVFSMLNMMIDIIFMNLTSVLGYAIQESELYGIYSSILSIALISGTSLIINQNYKKRLKVFTWKYMVLFAVLLIADSVVVLALGDLALNSLSYSLLYNISYILVVIGIFIQLAMVIWFMLSREVYREKELLMKKYLEEQVAHYSYLENRERETKKFRHDVKSHMKMLSTLYMQKDYEMFEKYMTEMNGKIDQFGNRICVGNGIADAIINQYYDEAGKKGIHLRVEGRFPPECSISAYDLCTIFSNLLSNAIRAELDYGGKEILVCCRYNAKEIIIEVANDYNRITRDENGKIVSSKKNSENHGFGLENVIECVERNQGQMDIKTENRRYRVLLTLVNLRTT